MDKNLHVGVPLNTRKYWPANQSFVWYKVCFHQCVKSEAWFNIFLLFTQSSTFKSLQSDVNHSSLQPRVRPSVLPARALMRERSNRRAELFSLSQSSASHRLLTPSLYCCWISMCSNSAATDVILTSPRLRLHRRRRCCCLRVLPPAACCR